VIRVAVVSADRGIAPDARSGAAIHLQRDVARYAADGAAVALLVARPAERPASPPHAVAPRGRLPSVLRRDAVRDAAVDAAAMARWARKLGPFDIVHERMSPAAAIGAALRPAEWVVEINAPLVWEAALYRGVHPDPRWIACERRALGGADRVEAVSASLADYAVRRGARPDRVVVRPPDADVCADPLGVDTGEGPFVLGWAGSFRPWHGLAEGLTELLALAAALAPRRLRVELVGDGPQRGKVLDALASAAFDLVAPGWVDAATLRAARGRWQAQWAPPPPWPPPGADRVAAALGEPLPDPWWAPLKAAEVDRARLYRGSSARGSLRVILPA
jgi:hypothetical protein